MALRMASPFEHPKTGVFWFRRGVPKDLQALLGKKEELLSLRTKDPAEARVRFAEVSAKVEARWASLRAGARALTETEAHALAQSVHDDWLRLHRDDPSFQVGWQANLYPTLWTAQLQFETEAEPGVPGEMPITNVFYRSMRRRCFEEADRLIARRGLVVDEWSRLKVARAVGAAIQRASRVLARAAEGEISVVEFLSHDVGVMVQAQESAELVRPSQAARRTAEPRNVPQLSITGLFEAWWSEAKAAGRKPSTRENYKNTIDNFVAFLKHDDAARVGPTDIVGFKNYRLSTPSLHTGRAPRPYLQRLAARA